MRETGGMMHILVNVIWSPRLQNGEALTYGYMLRDPAFKTAGEQSKKQNKDHCAITGAAGVLKDRIPPDTPVQMVCEVQLHLDHFMHERKKSHLWFKIIRAKSMSNLHYDCGMFR